MLKAFLKAGSQKYLDITFRIAGGHSVRIMERPGLWMKSDDLMELSGGLRQVAGKTLPAGDLTYGVFSGDRSRLETSIITLITKVDDNTPVAFNALAVMDVDLGHTTEEVLHLGLVMVDPDLRSQGLSWVLYGLTCVLMLFRNGMRPLWISNVTQVPSVVGLVSTGFTDVYPKPAAQGSGRSLMHLLLARSILREHRHVFGVGVDADFDEERFVITNAYTGGSDHLKKTYEDAPKHRDDAVNAFCREQLDYKRGDDVFQLGKIDLPTALSYIGRDVPRKSVFALGFAVAAVVIQRMALPIWHWFDGTRDFGVLRPWGTK
jgi:predicted N-acetyltransferase YhbS